MREIIFRGKRIEQKDWIYGSYIKYEHMGKVRHIIIRKYDQVYFNSFDVFSESVGQMTGLKDKNGKEIYEGDILDWGEFNKEDEGERAVVEWHDKNAGWMMKCYTIYGGEGYSMFEYLYEETEIIGNIYENPKLLEVESGV